MRLDAHLGKSNKKPKKEKPVDKPTEPIHGPPRLLAGDSILAGQLVSGRPMLDSGGAVAVEPAATALLQPHLP
jgi:hypothetical protein